MEKILETILAWFNPVNATIFLIGLGVFLWLVNRVSDDTYRK